MPVSHAEHAIAATVLHPAARGSGCARHQDIREGDFARAYDTCAHGLVSHFVWCKLRPRRAWIADLKQPVKARAVLQKLVERCDVLVQNS